MHEAWTGIPKIHVSTEDYGRLPREVFDAALRHEAAHSALHGTPEHYVVAVPASLAINFQRKGFTSEEIKLLAHLEASALKDLEASKLLVSLGYVADQAAFTLHNLEMGVEDRAAWKIASTSQKASTLYLAHMLKALAASIPLLETSYAPSIRAKRLEALSHLTPEARSRLESLEEALKKAEETGETFQGKTIILLEETLKTFQSNKAKNPS